MWAFRRHTSQPGRLKVLPRYVKSRLFLAALLFCAFLLQVASDSNSDTSPPPERYELCKDDTCIQDLQQQYGLIPVTSNATNAAMHTGWPESAIGLLSSFYVASIAPQFWKGRNHRGIGEALLASIIPIVIGAVWCIQFVVIFLSSRDTAGWISVTDSVLTAAYLPSAFALSTYLWGPFCSGVMLFQLAGSFVIVIFRWRGIIGRTAYSIIDSNSCTPFSSLAYLEQGARSGAFRIMQTVEMSWVTIFLITMGLSTATEDLESRPSESNEFLTRSGDIFQFLTAGILSYCYIPALVYTAVIASKGRPVVISGNCMLVELDPKWGFLDSEIALSWKAFVGITGL